jgi:glycosyltransferase involved in cell wall biosynthesis
MAVRVLFLPNFKVEGIAADDPSIFAANKIVAGDRYWFFRFLPGADVKVVDNSAPFLLRAISDRMKIELFQPFVAFLAQSQYDVLISHSYNSGLVLSLLRSLSRRKTPPHVVIDIGCLNGGRNKPLQLALIRFALRSVAGLVYHSSINEDFYGKHFPNVRRKFVPYGTDHAFFKPLESRPSDDYVLSIGYAKRDYRTLIEAWKDIDFPLKIVGTTAVDTAGLRNVELVPRVTISKLRDLIHNSRFVVLPILGDAYAVGQMTLSQCMSMGKTVVVADVPGISDYADDGVNCVKVRSGDANDYASKIKLLLGDPTTVGMLSANARRDVIERFSEEKMAKGIMDFIRTL